VLCAHTFRRLKPGFFGGTLEELERSQDEGDYHSRRVAIEPYVESVIAGGVYEIAVSWTGDGAAAS